ncbi:ammonium transporter, putative [Perkinsus marinus ATCC 50983]|uniref:Ammonium transporter, putative n=1 Tax=Perkinsus marinus (strain ATCC 50983 / TXsc) TaxID=423536 RepID=C5KTW4_PERM5|nr:ammonium transporter, putative [Perkinsus marinus ATCC 50983]EER12006.1 ammonium transporter, putative [Perkinsus marinus ATCC 50983]|eukprot:XP_002780211.1 ammonium transporter, putative [Perkinsus marinus ATCC 50983]
MCIGPSKEKEHQQHHINSYTRKLERELCRSGRLLSILAASRMTYSTTNTSRVSLEGVMVGINKEELQKTINLLIDQKIAAELKGVQEENARLREELDDNRRAFEENSKSRRLYYLTEAKQTDVVTGQLTSTMWRILTGAMIMFMQAGFAMLEAGSVRVYNVQAILMKNLLDLCISPIVWWLIGWGLAFGYVVDPLSGELTSGTEFSGGSGYAGTGLTEYCIEFDAITGDCVDEAPAPLGKPKFNPDEFFFFWTFSAAASTIVSGGVAERVRCSSYFLFSSVMSGFIYPVLVAWLWSGHGWLSKPTDGLDATYYDFAGSGVVHVTGGIAALVGAKILGPRKGRFDEMVDQTEFIPHSIPLIVLGTMILWFGWIGFNAGSTSSMVSTVDADKAARSAMNTVLSGASGGFTLFVIRLVFFNMYDVAGVCNGCLAGLVSITAGSANVSSFSALIIGIIGGCLYQTASRVVASRHIDDPIDAFAVHGMSGIWGTIACVLFDNGSGFSVFGPAGITRIGPNNYEPSVNVGTQLGVIFRIVDDNIMVRILERWCIPRI